VSPHEIQVLIDQEMRAAAARVENIKRDGRASVVSIQAAGDARVAEIDGVGGVEDDCNKEIFGTERRGQG
jgi:hypothetical protein